MTNTDTISIQIKAAFTQLHDTLRALGCSDNTAATLQLFNAADRFPCGNNEAIFLLTQSELVAAKQYMDYATQAQEAQEVSDDPRH